MEGNNIIKNIKSFNLSEKDYICSKINIYEKNSLMEYFQNLTEDSNWKCIEAYNQQDKCIAGLCYQICIGPLPAIPTFFKCGSIWGFWGNKSALEKLILLSVCDLRNQNIFKILSYAYNEEIFEILQNLRFSIFEKINDYITLCQNGNLINGIKKSSKNIKISVIIPVFNSSKSIKSAIRSIQNINMPDIEIIVIDDYSLDN